LGPPREIDGGPGQASLSTEQPRSADSAGEPRAQAGERILQAAASFSGRSSTAIEEVDPHRTPTGQNNRWASWGVEPICEQLQGRRSIYYAAKSRLHRAGGSGDAELVRRSRCCGKKNYWSYGRAKLTKRHVGPGSTSGLTRWPSSWPPRASEVRAGRRSGSRPKADPGSGARPGSGESELHCDRPESTLGCGLHLLLDVDRHRLCRVHHRRVSRDVSSDGRQRAR